MRLDQIAARTWDAERPITETSAVIHDGAITEEQLSRRARDYVAHHLLGTFPQATPPAPGAAILEIGSGLGWIMQAMNDYMNGLGRAPRSLTGLDIAANMIEQAKRRLPPEPPFGYLLYDGITVPLADASLDLIYSVAALQHVPRPFVFNLFFEMRRLLKPGGFAVFHLLSTAAIAEQEKFLPWRLEVLNQIHGATTHWHHFYTRRELLDVLAVTGFAYNAVVENGSSLICCVSNSPLHIPADFSERGYLTRNPDIVGMAPRAHWLQYGHAEGRRWR